MSGAAGRTAKFGGYIWLAPMVAFLLMFEMWPFLIMLDQSVHALSYTQPTMNGQFVGLNNYRKLVFDSDFFHSVGLTLLFMLVALAIEFVLALGFSVLLSYHLRLKRIVLSLLLIPMILAPIVVGLTARLNLNPDFGLIGILLRKWGLSHSGVLADGTSAFLTIVAVDIWQWMPFLVMIFVAAIISMPREPFEAAEVEGANRWQIFRHITFPLLQPIIIVGFLLRLTDSFKIFDQIFIMTGGGPGASTELATIFAYKVNFVSWNLGYGSAVVAVLFLISFILTFVLLKLMTRFTRGAVA
jgi:multiple sugar transport system permease protein